MALICVEAPEVERSRSTPELAEALGVSSFASTVASLNDVRIAEIAELLRSEPAVSTPVAWDDPRFWNVAADRAERSQYFAVGNAINFRFWSLSRGEVKPAVGVLDGESYRGAMYMWRALRRAVARGRLPVLDAACLAEFSDEHFDEVFCDDRGHNPLDPARADRISNLRDLGACLLRDYDGSFVNVVDESDTSLLRFAELSAGFRAFDDPVHKLTMVNAILHAGSGVHRFADEPLPAIDYHLVRHALRQGMVTPSGGLAAKLVAGTLLDATEGQQLRRVTLAAFVRLSAQSGVGGAILDNRFWLNRMHCADPPVCVGADATRCAFLTSCAQRVAYGLPLELTRYY